MKKTAALALLLLSALGCRDLFEKDIQERQVEVISPVDNATAVEGEITFLWKEIESALEYHITIVSPGFGNSSMVVADTVIHDSLPVSYRYRQYLGPGEYQWNIRARNSAYNTRDNILNLYVEHHGEEDDNGDGGNTDEER
ncbi:MAG: hypothetical protein LUD76_05285 [Alistipes sp.]|nr:hypothetical protein [Alistipes sp.]